MDDDNPAFDDPNYAVLKSILEAAYLQAQSGKGAERHGGGLAFEDQPMQTISQLVRSPDGMAYQAIKKIQESLRLPPERAERELLGAINYAAGMIIYRRMHDCHQREDEPVIVNLNSELAATLAEMRKEQA